MRVDLAGQVALITGANRGIGRHMAMRLADAGASVALGARQPQSLDATIAEMAGGNDRHLAVQLDVTDEASIKAANDAAIERYGQIDLLVNNAGIGAGAEHPWDQPVDDWWAVMEVNVRGPYLCTQAVMPHMLSRGSGRIIDVGSLIGASPNPTASPYAVSKAALFRWTSCLAAGAEPFGIKAFIISPGLVATDMTAGPRFAHIPASEWVPIERTGDLIVSLASGEADALSGRFIHALDDLPTLVAHADEINAGNLHALTLNTLDSPD